MPRKKNPILGRAWDLIAFSINPMTRLRKSNISRNLFLFKKTKRFHLLRHYNYAFVGEYEFSPSNSTPLCRHPHLPVKKRSRFLSLLLICGGNGAESNVEAGLGDEEVEVLSMVRDGSRRDASEVPDSEEDDVSVDQRAEMFIERFYEEMRIQRRRSL